VLSSKPLSPKGCFSSGSSTSGCSKTSPPLGNTGEPSGGGGSGSGEVPSSPKGDAAILLNFIEQIIEKKSNDQSIRTRMET
jgi:hypothetical protein